MYSQLIIFLFLSNRSMFKISTNHKELMCQPELWKFCIMIISKKIQRKKKIMKLVKILWHHYHKSYKNFWFHIPWFYKDLNNILEFHESWHLVNFFNHLFFQTKCAARCWIMFELFLHIHLYIHSVLLTCPFTGVVQGLLWLRDRTFP